MRYLNPILWARWFGGFVVQWVLSIPWGRVSHALPALVLMVAIASGAVIAISEGTDWRDNLLDRQLVAAWERDDFETTELVIRRQLAHDPNDNETIHKLALTLNAQDKHESAAELMRQLVSVKEHEESARWLLSKEYVGKQWHELSDEQRDELGLLLRVIHQESPNDLNIKQMYADYLIAAEKYPQAVPILETLSHYQPMRGLQAAAISRRLGNNVVAERLARRTLDEVAAMSEEDPTNTNLAMSVAQNQLFLKRYADAVRTLHRAIDRTKTDEDRVRLRSAMGDSIVTWVNFIEESPMESLRDRLRVLKMLQTALAYAPKNPRVLTLVADRVLASMNEDDEGIAAIREALIQGTSPGIAHFIQGTAALINEDAEQAKMHLEIAAELMPNSGAILNNLAVALTTRDDQHLEEALKLSDRAVKQTAEPAPHFYETRGQILFRLNRYMEAIPDLERALKHPSLAPKAHQSLAKCYAEIGETELSQRHHQAAEAGGAPLVDSEPESKEPQPDEKSEG